jgi:hypothetical protein
MEASKGRTLIVVCRTSSLFDRSETRTSMQGNGSCSHGARSSLNTLHHASMRKDYNRREGGAGYHSRLYSGLMMRISKFLIGFHA